MRFCACKPIYVGIQGKEFICIVESGKELPAYFLHPFFVVFEIVPWRGVGNHIPSDRVAAKPFDVIERVNGIPKTFRHLVAILVEHKTI